MPFILPVLPAKGIQQAFLSCLSLDSVLLVFLYNTHHRCLLIFFFSFNEFSLQVGPNSFIEFHMESFYPVFFCSVYSFLPFSKGRVMQYSPVLFIMYFAITEMVLFSTKILSEKCTFQFFSISQN